MKDIKIIFFDIDGTLIALDKEDMSEKTKETLRKLRENGIKICIATGRGPLALPHFKDVEFDLFLTYNGSYSYDAQGNTIFSNAISADDVQRLIQNTQKIDHPVAVATKDRVAANGKDDDLEEYFAFGNQDIDAAISDDFAQVAKEDVYQLMISAKEEDYDSILDGVKGAAITAWWERAVDIIPANGGKGMAIEHVLKYYGYDRSQAMAFGDGNNDIAMIQAVGTGVAMENASQDLKAAADTFCPDVAEDGVYQYCLENHLIK